MMRSENLSDDYQVTDEDARIAAGNEFRNKAEEIFQNLQRFGPEFYSTIGIVYQTQ